MKLVLQQQVVNKFSSSSSIPLDGYDASCFKQISKQEKGLMCLFIVFNTTERLRAWTSKSFVVERNLAFFIFES